MDRKAKDESRLQTVEGPQNLELIIPAGLSTGLSFIWLSSGAIFLQVNITQPQFYNSSTL